MSSIFRQRRDTRRNSIAVAALGVAVLSLVGGDYVNGAQDLLKQSDPGLLQYAGQLHQYPRQDADEAVAQTLAGLDSQRFVDLTVGPRPSYAPGDDGAVWVYETVRGDLSQNGLRDIEGVWEADLAQGAIADRLAGGGANLHDAVAGSTITLVAGDDASEDVPSGGGMIAAGQYFEAQRDDRSDDAIVDDLTRSLTELGLDATDISVLHPLGPAVSIIARAPDDSEMAGEYLQVLAALQGPVPAYEGVFLEIDDEDGTPLVRASTALRTGAFRTSLAQAEGAGLGRVRTVHG